MRSSLFLASLATLSLCWTNTGSATGYGQGINAGTGMVHSVAASASGQKALKRLLRPHSIVGNPITQAVRDATGDPDIVVFDHRHGYDDVFTCSYITYRGKRALTCD